MFFSFLFISLSLQIIADDKAQSDINDRLDQLTIRIDQVNGRLARLESLLTQIQSVLNQVQGQVTKMQVGLAHVDKVSSWFEQPLAPPASSSNNYVPGYIPAP